MAPNFYEEVWAFVRGVPSGSVVTYGQVAVLLGSPSAARAVGYALRALPPDTDIPWWRVINARGGISLKGRGGGADLQRSRLEDEGVVFGNGDTVDLRRYRWWPGEDDAGAEDEPGDARDDLGDEGD